MRSQAFVYHGPGDVRLETRDVPCGDTDLLVKVRASARCGTDVTIFNKGHYKVDSHAPVVLGHELVGEIVEVGRNVAELRDGIGYKEGETLSEEYLDFRPGERVTVQSRIARYRDGLMLIQDPITILSFYIDGGNAKYMRIPEELIRTGSALRVPGNVSDEAGALVEPAACALESIFSTPHPVGVDRDGRHIYSGGIRQGGLTAVIGSGTVSMIYARLARLEGARKVYVLVRSEEKAQLVARVLGEGFEPLMTGGLDQSEIVELVAQETDGYLFDDVIAACADPNAQRLMLELYTHEGYAVGACFGGTHELVDDANIDSNHYRMAKTIGSSGCSTRTMETILRWLEDGRLSLDGFSSPRIWTLDDDPAEFFTTRETGLKPILYPWGR